MFSKTLEQKEKPAATIFVFGKQDKVIPLHPITWWTPTYASLPVPVFWKLKLKIFLCQAFPIFLWAILFPCAFRREAIHDSVYPGIAYDTINKHYDTSLWIPAVTEQEHLPIRADVTHSLAHHSDGNFQLCLLFIPKSTGRRNRQIPYGTVCQF